MKQKPIGILDSGVGGLTIWKEIQNLLPNEQTVYIADSGNAPYGSKSDEEIFQLAKRLVQFLLAQEVKLIVIACNTITVSSLARLRADFPTIPIIGTVPVVKLGVAKSKTQRIGVLSTRATAGSSYQKALIKKFAASCFVLNRGIDSLVPLIEQGDVESLAMQNILRKELEPFIQAKIDVLVLGCTHFPFVKNAIQAIIGSTVLLLDSGEAIARQVKRVLQNEQLLAVKKTKHNLFYTTGSTERFSKVLQSLVGERQNATIQAINL